QFVIFSYRTKMMCRKYIWNHNGSMRFALILMLSFAGTCLGDDRASVGSAAAGENTLGERGLGTMDMGQRLGEETDPMRELCTAYPKDPRCAQYTRAGMSHFGRLASLCKKDPFNAQCERYKEKSFDFVQHVAQICDRDQRSRQCQRMMKNLNRRPKI